MIELLLGILTGILICIISFILGYSQAKHKTREITKRNVSDMVKHLKNMNKEEEIISVQGKDTEDINPEEADRFFTQWEINNKLSTYKYTGNKFFYLEKGKRYKGYCEGSDITIKRKGNFSVTRDNKYFELIKGK